MSEVQKLSPGQPIDDLVDPAPAAEEAPPAAPFRCTISADLFLRAWQARSTEKERLNISGVYIEPCRDGGAILTATNGGVLITIRDPNAIVDGSAIVKLNDLMIRACKAKKSDLDVTERVLLIDNFDGDAMPEAIIAHCFVDGDTGRDLAMSLFDEPTDMIICREYGQDLIVNAQFPNWRGVVPYYGEMPGLSAACWDARLHSMLAAAFTAPGGKQTPLSWFTHPKEPATMPILVKPYPFSLLRYDMPFEGLAIVMPVVSNTTCDVPSWARAAA